MQIYALANFAICILEKSTITRDDEKRSDAPCHSRVVVDAEKIDQFVFADSHQED